MTERDIIIERLVKYCDHEAGPDFVRLVMDKFKTDVYNDDVHQKILAAVAEFDAVVVAGREPLRRYYSALDPESLVECFDHWCCHQYR